MQQGLSIASRVSFFAFSNITDLVIVLLSRSLVLQCEAVLNKSERHMEKLVPYSKHIKAERALNYFSVPWLESVPLGHRHRKRNK